jgi:UDP-N-acetylmuramyl pentapeptide synthase
VDWLIALGELAQLAVGPAGAQGVRTDIVESIDEAAALLRPELTEDDVVLVKASRGMELERVVEALTDDN